MSCGEAHVCISRGLGYDTQLFTECENPCLQSQRPLAAESEGNLIVSITPERKSQVIQEFRRDEKDTDLPKSRSRC